MINLEKLVNIINLHTFKEKTILIKNLDIDRLVRIYDRYITIECIIINSEIDENKLQQLINNLKNIKGLKSIQQSVLYSEFFENLNIKINDLKICQDNELNLKFLKKLKLVSFVTNKHIDKSFLDSSFLTSLEYLESLEFYGDQIVRKRNRNKYIKIIKKNIFVQIWLVIEELYYCNLFKNQPFKSLDLLIKKLKNTLN